ncbi:MAG: hypothetical protein FWH11_11970 [Micrococcales bacterium]|nr:hypothetical protein [Micrococcales bacterium]
MARSSCLDEAVAVFKELGWDEAAVMDVPMLPLGTDRRTALAGLRSGQWGSVELAGVVVRGVERGWLDRDEAVGLVLTAMDTASRPVDRKAWLDDLAVTGAGQWGSYCLAALTRQDIRNPLSHHPRNQAGPTPTCPACDEAR